MGFFSVLVFMFMRILRQDFSSCLTLIDFRWMTEAIMLVGKWVLGSYGEIGNGFFFLGTCGISLGYLSFLFVFLFSYGIFS